MSIGFERLTKIMGSWKHDLEPSPPIENEEPKGLLYHYTTPEGLLGILKSGSIRATHVRYLNDQTELRNALSSEFENLMLNTMFPAADEEQRKNLHDLKRRDEETQEEEVFVASFTDDGVVQGAEGCTPGDRLSQWRAYSNQAGGFSLAFDSKQLMAPWKSKAPLGAYRSSLLRCKYGADEKRDAAERVGKWGLGLVQRVHESQLDHFRGKVGVDPDPGDLRMLEFGSDAYAWGAANAVYFSSEAARFKDEAFSEEREWRFVLHARRSELLDAHHTDPGSPVIHFRNGRFGLTPYMEIPLRLSSDESPLRRVVTGPSQQGEEAVAGVRLLLESMGIKLGTQASAKCVEVVQSRTPYRI